ncbi:hypothetical protein CYMTET_36927 [Cymbomonas tetramitiformis]|uniref:Uncharacterized protein n=1 Tax=Cymbomonas tetramitiformis TaxID=36881 RepID=A0AAE0F7R1_9CHLO|nr:hypothetical protein CYMTET_36927 [Cymbomonas tetramitiformis]
MPAAVSNGRVVYDGRPDLGDTKDAERSADEYPIAEKTLIVVASAEAYAMIAGGLLEACEAALNNHAAEVGWNKVHVRIVSDNVPFRFEAQQLMEVVKEQKRFSSLRMIGTKKNLNTAHRVLADLAYVVGRLDMNTSRCTIVACLLKSATLGRECEAFLRQLVSTGSYPVTVFLDVTRSALRWPHVSDTKHADDAHQRLANGSEGSNELTPENAKDAGGARARAPETTDVSRETVEASFISDILETDQTD